VRFSAPGGVAQVRLEVFDAGGASVYNSEFQPGNVRDWALLDKQGQPLADGSYLCVVTLRGSSKRMSVRQGTVAIQNGQASLQLGEGGAVGAVEPEKTLAADGASAGTFFANDGRVGQVVSTSGALTFRVSDLFGGADKELMRLTPDGNLGVGVSLPRAKLDVAGTIRASQGIEFADGTVQTTGLSGRKDVEGNVAPLAAGAGTLNQVAKWKINGFVGIGTTTPRGQLDIFGAPNKDLFAGMGTDLNAGPAFNFGYAGLSFGRGAGFFNVRPDASATAPNPSLRFMTVNQERMIVTNAGNVGIGTSNPQSKLEVSGSLRISGAGSALVFADGTSMTSAAGGGATPSGTSIISAINDPATAGAINDNRLSSNLARLNGANNWTGANNFTTGLDVTGDLRVTGNAVVNGNIAAKYQDVAEWVPARGNVAAGTVVVLDAARSNGVMASSRRYDTHVAGVVSAQPGVILGQGGEGQVLVATTGRVKVMADATLHPIRVGDLLVTSDTPGAAMKSLPVRVGGSRLHRPGTIIGKALEPLAGGKGEILVLLSLQ
jgi:hypothetical protein